MAMASGDDQLLLEFTRTGSEGAFAALVAQHANWVYAAALRSLGDPHLAEDVTQAVFLLLLRQPGKALGKPLSGWLFKVMRYSVINTQRAIARRARHEQMAAERKTEIAKPPSDSLWEEMVPLLEDLMARLKAKDRDLLLLRFYEGRSLTEIGAVLHISEDAARKRVAAAVERLRSRFRARGVSSPGIAMASVLTARLTAEASPALASTLISSASAPSESVAGLVQGVSKMLFLQRLSKFAASIVLFVGVAGALVLLVTRAPAQAPALSLAADPSAVVNFENGASDFQPGDSITITEIRGTSDQIAPGNTYQITGTYRLSSQPQARLAIFTTATQRGQNDNGPYGENHLTIQSGTGQFTLTLIMRVPGYPHVSFYPPQRGGSFGYLFFGTGQSVQKNPPQNWHDSW